VAKGPPNNPQAEKSVLGQMMRGGPKVAGVVIGTQLEPGDFYSAPNRAIFETIHQSYYKDLPLDPLNVAERAMDRLQHLWGTESSDEIATRVRGYMNIPPGDVVDHSKLIKHDSDLRKLEQVAYDALGQIEAREKTPQEIGADISHQAMQVATATLLTSDIMSFAELGRRYLTTAEEERQARLRGKELGAHFGMRFIDNWTRGVRPTELWFIGGEPGSGKSATAWNAGMRFAERQAAHNPPNEQIGCFILSLEMGENDSEVRLAQSITKIDGAKLREARQTPDDMNTILRQWGRRKDIPLFFNFTSSLRASQLRAMVVEAIRRHNCGLVIIDHFRYFDLDHRLRDTLQEDEEKARFLKEDIAKDLNVAVVCLAHTTKSIEAQTDRRPTLSNLRGSGLVAAHADFVSFVYRPYMYASEKAKNEGMVFDTDAEMIFRKNRHGVDGISQYFFEPHTMTVDDPR